MPYIDLLTELAAQRHRRLERTAAIHRLVRQRRLEAALDRIHPGAPPTHPRGLP